MAHLNTISLNYSEFKTLLLASFYSLIAKLIPIPFSISYTGYRSTVGSISSLLQSHIRLFQPHHLNILPHFFVVINLSGHCAQMTNYFLIYPSPELLLALARFVVLPHQSGTHSRFSFVVHLLFPLLNLTLKHTFSLIRLLKSVTSRPSDSFLF